MIDLPIFDPDRAPVPRSMTLALLILAVLSVFLMHGKSGGETSAMTWLFAVLAVASAISGWFLLRSQAESARKFDVLSKGMLLIHFGALIALVSTFVNGMETGSTLAVVLAYLSIVLLRQYGLTSRLAGLIFAPIACGMVFVGTAGVLGNPSHGIFPAIISALFILVMRVTLGIEREILTKHNGADDHQIFLMFRTRLAWTAIAFFLFGVVSFWPWLGTIYGDVYFWMLLVGVILPLVFFWGRLRQPRSEGAQVALLRFNRVSPYIGIILLAAFAIG